MLLLWLMVLHVVCEGAPECYCVMQLCIINIIIIIIIVVVVVISMIIIIIILLIAFCAR